MTKLHRWQSFDNDLRASADGEIYLVKKSVYSSQRYMFQKHKLHLKCFFLFLELDSIFYFYYMEKSTLDRRVNKLQHFSLLCVNCLMILNNKSYNILNSLIKEDFFWNIER